MCPGRRPVAGRGVFTSVRDLVDAIQTWSEHSNGHPKPFVWHKTAAEIIIESVRRGRATLTQGSNPRRTPWSPSHRRSPTVIPVRVCSEPGTLPDPSQSL